MPSDSRYWTRNWFRLETETPTRIAAGVTPFGRPPGLRTSTRVDEHPDLDRTGDAVMAVHNRIRGQFTEALEGRGACSRTSPETIDGSRRFRSMNATVALTCWSIRPTTSA